MDIPKKILKISERITTDKDFEKALYIFLINNRKYPLSPTDAKLAIDIIKRTARGDLGSALRELLKEVGRITDKIIVDEKGYRGNYCKKWTKQ